MKIVSQLNAAGYFVGPVEADESPLEPGKLHIPGGAIDQSPPDIPQGMRARWVSGAWQFEPLSLEPDPEPVPEVLSLADFDKALTRHLDATAQSRRYDNRISCMVRAGFPGPFQTEATAFAVWADGCNALAYQLMAEVQAGTRALPTSTQALIDLLPPMVWPA